MGGLPLANKLNLATHLFASACLPMLAKPYKWQRQQLILDSSRQPSQHLRLYERCALQLFERWTASLDWNRNATAINKGVQQLCWVRCSNK